jgi:molybdate transport system ATP-binding protein
MDDTQGLRVRLTQDQPIPLDIDLYCRPGEVLALVGPSGSGKTTVLRAIAGLHHPEHGSVGCQDEVWMDSARDIYLDAHQRKVGLVFQHYALFPHFTALGNVLEALTHLPKPQRHERARALLRRVHLGGLDDRYPHELSGGQQQRVAVARALAREPKVLLLDEPFSAVDQVTRRRLYRELNELRRSLSMPIVLVTHDLEEATLLADRLCLLHRGVTLQAGTPLEVAARPVSALVCRLMDQQNLFTGQVMSHDPQNRITRLRWRGLILEARYQPEYAVQQRVCWMIQSANVLLHRRGRHSNGDRENPLSGTIVEYMVLGEHVSVLVQVDRQLRINLAMTVPLHVARRNALAYGEQVTVSLLADGIHLMPFEKLRGDRAGEDLV